MRAIGQAIFAKLEKTSLEGDIMMKTFLLSLSVCSLLAAAAFGHPSYRGYSGAPGSNGTCASSCHGTSGGTIQITGFPDEYQPGQTYEVSITHDGGQSIRQFNGSCRIGTGSDNAGEITGGYLTSTYNVNPETNGVHLSSTSQDSATFNWTAPDAGTGEVRLYIAGLQGGHSGQNSTIVLVSNESTVGIDDEANIPDKIRVFPNYPNPFNAVTTIGFELPSDVHVTIEVYNIQGQLVETALDRELPAGYHMLAWDAGDMPSGIYYYSINAGGKVFRESMTLLK
jgi:hypothetical protein